jgi:hypothetical protein
MAKLTKAFETLKRFTIVVASRGSLDKKMVVQI